MARGLTYVATFTAVSVSVAQDLFSVLAAANVPVEILWARLSAEGVTAPAELRLNVKRLSATAALGSLGTVITPQEKGQRSARSAVSTVHANDTTRATSTGTTGILHSESAQVLNGWDYPLIPELFDALSPGEAWVFGLEAAPGAAAVLSGTVCFRELV